MIRYDCDQIETRQHHDHEINNFFRSCDDFQKLSITNVFETIPEKVKIMFTMDKNINWM